MDYVLESIDMEILGQVGLIKDGILRGQRKQDNWTTDQLVLTLACPSYWDIYPKGNGPGMSPKKLNTCFWQRHTLPKLLRTLNLC